MDERERKVIAFLLGIIWKLSIDGPVNKNEVQQICNLMAEFGTDDLDDLEFRY